MDLNIPAFKNWGVLLLFFFFFFFFFLFAKLLSSRASTSLIKCCIEMSANDINMTRPFRIKDLQNYSNYIKNRGLVKQETLVIVLYFY